MKKTSFKQVKKEAGKLYVILFKTNPSYMILKTKKFRKYLEGTET